MTIEDYIEENKQLRTIIFLYRIGARRHNPHVDCIIGGVLRCKSCKYADDLIYALKNHLPLPLTDETK